MSIDFLILKRMFFFSHMFLSCSLCPTETVISLDAVLRESLEQQFHQLSQQIEWTNLAVKYQTHIDRITFTLKEQLRVAEQPDEQKYLWAMQAMMPSDSTGLYYWLEQYNEMMTGEDHLRPEKPLLQLYMETRWQGSCDDSYIQDVEALWALTQTTQVRAHLAILNAEEILGPDVALPDINVRELMEKIS